MGAGQVLQSQQFWLLACKMADRLVCRTGISKSVSAAYSSPWAKCEYIIRLDVRESRTGYDTRRTQASVGCLPNSRRGEQPYSDQQRTKPPLCQRRKAPPVPRVVVMIVEVCIITACSLRCSSRVTLASTICRSSRLCQHDHALLITRLCGAHDQPSTVQTTTGWAPARNVVKA